MRRKLLNTLKQSGMSLTALLLFLAVPGVWADDLFDAQMRLARAGDAEAQFRLGEMYETGTGVSQNHREAIYWITRSANQGHEIAGFKLLYWNLERKGLKGKNRTGLEDLNKMAQQGNAQAQYYLGRIYAHGVGVEKNRDEAISWLNKAVLSGVADAEPELVALKAGHKIEKQDKAGFKADPCSGKTARFLSTCR